MTYAFSDRSLERMNGLHHDLVAVMHRALQITPIDFTVIEGLRTEARQKVLVAQGKSQTMNSRHLTGHAIDVAPVVNGRVSWDWKHYYPLAKAIKQAASDLGVNIEWGGDWTSLKDGPHWQLSWSTYDKGDMTSKRQENLDDSRILKIRSTPAQSRTVQASVVQGASAIGGAVGALNALDGTAQIVALAGCFLVGLAAMWIFKERLRKWGSGDR